MTWKKIALAVGAAALSLCALAVGLAMKGASQVAGVGAGVDVGVKQAMAPDQDSNAKLLNKGFLQMRDEMKQTLPKQIAVGLLQYDVAVDGAMVTYFYRFTDHPAAFYGSQIDANQREELKATVCGQPKILKTFKMGASFRYNYSGSDGKQIGSITLDARACSATS